MPRFAVLAAAAAAAVAVAVPHLAHAQTLASSRPAEPNAASADRYSPTAALALSLGATTVGAGLFAYGAFSDGDTTTRATLVDVGVVATYLGPSAGHVYTGEFFTRGLAVRTAGALLVGAGLATELGDCGFTDDACDASPLAYGLLIAGAAISTAGVVDDIATAPRRARRLNRAAASLSLAPQVAPGRAGVAVVGTF